MMRRIILSLCFVLSLAAPVHLSQSGAARNSLTIKVAAGPFDRRETVVSFALPKELKDASYVLRDESGRAVPLQVDAMRQAAFVLSELRAGATKSYRLEATGAPGAPAAQGVQATRTADEISVTAASRPVLKYRSGPGELPNADVKPIFRRGGYIHPVYTPSGRVITDDYPEDHRHHHGVWFAWTKTEFDGRSPDFWNMGDGTGKVEFVSLDETWQGPVHAGLKARHRYLDLSGPQPAAVLNEEWRVIVYGVRDGAAPYTMFDLISTQECATARPLILPEYRYGGVGFRGHRDWLGKDNCTFLTSEGKDRSNGHGTRARWCHIGGRVDGELAGIAILDHPGNFRAPQPMRIHPSEPFFCFAPSQMGRWEITPGRPYVSRYRFIVYDGPPNRSEIERMWNDYATPPQVTISLR